MEALRITRDNARRDRERVLLQDRVDRTYADELRRTDAALDWQRNKQQKICHALYWAIMAPLCVLSLGVFYLFHLLIIRTYGKPVYWLVFIVFAVGSWGLYIPLHFLYTFGYGKGQV